MNANRIGDNAPDVARSDLRSELVVQEYLSLRTESQTAKQNQQSILQWTMATVGIGIAAVFATSAPLFDPKTHSRQWILIADVAILGVAIPALAALAFAIWLGELERMERAGMYLRAKERSLNGISGLSPARLSKTSSMDLVLWESMLARPGRKNPYRKNRIGAGASCLLFSAVFGGSLASAVFILHASSTLRSILEIPGETVCTAIALIFALLFCSWFGKQVLAFSRETASGPKKAGRFGRWFATWARRIGRKSASQATDAP